MEKLLDNKYFWITLVSLLLFLIALDGFVFWKSIATKPLEAHNSYLPVTHEDPKKVTASTTSIATNQESVTYKIPDPEKSTQPLLSYIEIIDGCGPYYDTGVCVNMRAGPGLEYPVVERLRTGIVLRVDSQTTTQDGLKWYKVMFDKGLRYSDRLPKNLYVAVDPEAVAPFQNSGDVTLSSDAPTTTKRIVIDLSKNTLYAYNGDTLFMEAPVSKGLKDTPTPAGAFEVFFKTPTRYMQGPLPGISDQYYDLPGVPWDLYFTHQGGAIHGAYWHNHFGEPWSHGCVNLSLKNAKNLYMWADIGTPVLVHR